MAKNIIKRWLAKLQGGDEANMIKFVNEQIRNHKEEIRNLEREIETLETRKEEAEMSKQDVIDNIDPTQLKTLDTRKKYYKVFDDQIVEAMNTIIDLDEEIEGKHEQIEVHKEFITLYEEEAN